MTGHSWRIVRIYGVDVRIDSSWLIIAALVSYGLAAGLGVLYPGAGSVVTAGIAVLGAALFFGSVLFHELTHALVARRRGFKVKDITLFLFGGSTQADVESRKPFDEFIVSVVGPLSSFVLAGVFDLARLLVPTLADGAVAGILGYLGWANLLLGAFNLLPGLPLDGGRVLRSALWQWTGNLDRSTKVASVAGEVFGYGLMVLGALVFFAGVLLQGLWFAAIGWFLAGSARASYNELRVRRLLGHVEAADIMETKPVHIPSGTSVAEAVDHYLLRHDHDAFAVTDAGRIVGVVTLESVRKIPKIDWANRSIDAVMTPVTDETIVEPRTPVVVLLERLAESPDSIAVGYPGHLLGVITRWDLTVWLRRRDVAAGQSTGYRSSSRPPLRKLHGWTAGSAR